MGNKKRDRKNKKKVLVEKAENVTIPEPQEGAAGGDSLEKMENEENISREEEQERPSRTSRREVYVAESNRLLKEALDKKTNQLHADAVAAAATAASRSQQPDNGEETDDAMEVDEPEKPGPSGYPEYRWSEVDAAETPVQLRVDQKDLMSAFQPQAQGNSSPHVMNLQRLMRDMNTQTRYNDLAQQRRENQLGLEMKWVCIYHPCTKKAQLPCVNCSKLLYCCDSHRRKSKNFHLPNCDSPAYRVIKPQRENRSQTIASRTVRRCQEITSVQNPMLILPGNPKPECRDLPRDFCVNCFGSGKEMALCGGGCGLYVCKGMHRGIMASVEYWTPSHPLECRLLSLAKKHGLREPLHFNHHDVGLLRTHAMGNFADNKNISSVYELVGTINPIPPASYSKEFKSKLNLMRTYLHVDGSVVSDEILYRIDQALLRYGRNINLEAAPYKTDGAVPTYTVYTRNVYLALAHVSHSCVPNAMQVITDLVLNKVQLVALAEIEKGSFITYCYDQGCLFLPTIARRRYIEAENGFICRCARCASASELKTYYSSNPCSHCRTSFLIPGNPLDEFSNWACEKCQRVIVTWLRVISSNSFFKAELDQAYDKDVVSLLNLLHELVDEGMLHWKHHLVFEYSVKLFDLLFEELSKNNNTLMEFYSRDKGQRFLKPAETVLEITRTFMPNGYSPRHLLSLRLAAIVKLRQLLNRYKAGEINLGRLDEFVNLTYFRGFDITRVPLHTRSLTVRRNTPNLNILEAKLLTDVEAAVIKNSGCKWQANGLKQLFDWRKANCRVHGKNVTGIFPWDFDV